MKVAPYNNHIQCNTWPSVVHIVFKTVRRSDIFTCSFTFTSWVTMCWHSVVGAWRILWIVSAALSSLRGCIITNKLGLVTLQNKLPNRSSNSRFFSLLNFSNTIEKQSHFENFIAQLKSPEVTRKKKSIAFTEFIHSKKGFDWIKENNWFDFLWFKKMIYLNEIKFVSFK